MAGSSRYCEKCNRTLDSDSFYGSNNEIKYPDGKLKQCKKCITMHVDNFNPDTFLWILQECDVPYILEEWNKLMATYGKDTKKLTGMSILGRYLSKMKLKQFKEFRWKDNEFLQELNNSKIEQTMKQQGYDAATIAQAIDRASITIPEGDLVAAAQIPTSVQDDSYGVYEFEPAQTDFDDDLTEEDRTYLRLKWGKTYKPEEWIKLEQLYEEMMRSYDIQAAGDINTLKLVCKCSLKANQLMDLGDIDGAQKATKMYDSLMKSGKWTAQQIKDENSDIVDSVGELVLICERDGFIPKYYVAGPQDHVDRTIEDLQKYTYDLIDGESNLSELIESAVKQIQEENDRIKEAADSGDEDGEFEDKLFDYDNSNTILGYDDYTEFTDLEEELKLEDEELFKSFFKEDEE